MSKENVKKMFITMQTDAKLQKKFAEGAQLNGKKPENVQADLLVEFGKAAGFVFSKEELLAARAELMDKSKENRELCDDDLVNVAGGAGQKPDQPAANQSVNYCFHIMY